MTLQLLTMAKDIKNFRGLFVKNKLPKIPLWNECAIVNLDNEDGSGTHWVAYKKFGNKVIYFDSFGNLKPPEELVRYWGEDKIINSIETLFKRLMKLTVVSGPLNF